MRWIVGPPPGPGRYWIVWRIAGSRIVTPVELSPAVIYAGDPNAALLIKTMPGVAYPLEANRERIKFHVPIEEPTAPPAMYPCGCSCLKVELGKCDSYEPGEVP